jgi:hypothetical protein
MMEVTLHLPDILYERAQQWAAITHQELDEALTDALNVVLTPIHTSPELETPVESLTDDELLAEAALRMPPERGRRLSELSTRRREGLLSDEEQQELLALAQLYQRLWLRQSEALAEAARRGLSPGMHP